MSIEEAAPGGAVEKKVPRTRAPRKKGADTSAREVPYPGTSEGSVFHYTPEEAARFLPWSELQLRRKAYARTVPHNGGASRITFTGLDIAEISAMTAVRPLAEAEPIQQRSA